MKSIIIKLGYLSAILSVMLLINSCELDNYDAPDASLSGRIVDSETGELIESDIINGTTIKITEHGYDPVTPQYLKVKNDGTYANTMLFSNTYTIQPDVRNFLQIDPQEVKIGKDTKLDFSVTPYIRVKDVSITQAGNDIVATFRLQQLTPNVVDRIGFYVHGEPIVGEPVRSVASEKKLNRVVGEDEVFRLGINAVKNSAFLKQGGSYFFRVGAVSSFAGAKFNYAPAKQIEIGVVDPNAEPPKNIMDACESTNGWGSAGPLSLNADHKEGNYSLKTSLSGNAVPVFDKTFQPFNTGVSIEGGVFSFWLYLSDASKLPTNIADWGSQIELTSSGGPDSQELTWGFHMLKLNNGWNKIELKLSDAVPDDRGGRINLSAVNYFRMYHLFCSGDVDVMIDEISFYEVY
jgi:hypothetical protein